jgi:biotin synthase
VISGLDINYSAELSRLSEKVLSGNYITKAEAVVLTESPNLNLLDLLSCAEKIRREYAGNQIDLCAIVNAKSGACSEDCSYCAQSSKNKTGAAVFPLLDKDTILQKADEAKSGGVRRFSIVTSGKKISTSDMRIISSVFQKLRDMGLIPCASLGILSRDELSFLKDKGLDRYHHNLETSERFFPMICSTHTFAERLRTIESAQEAGLSVCSGGIFGMGETWQDRLDMAFLLRDLDVQSIPINFLIPIKGTPLAERETLHPFEALKIICLFRFILSEKSIRICGGREHILREFHPMVFMAGADAMMTGNYLTTTGRTFEDDIRLIRLHGLLPPEIFERRDVI